MTFSEDQYTQNSFILAFSIAFAFLFSTCEKESNPITLLDPRPVLTQADFGRLVLTLPGYDTVRVTHELGIDLRTPNIVRIGVGTKDSTVQMQSRSYATTYDPGAQAYVVRFDFVARLDSSRVDVPLTVRYYFADSTFTDVDTTVLAYKFPYPSTEIVVRFSSLPSTLSTAHPQDVDRIGSAIFFHPTGPLGLYKYNLTTGHVDELFRYSSGDFIAADSSFVFCDVSGRVHRYNLNSNQVDLIFPSSFRSISGMDARNGFLFVGDNYVVVKRYTFDGILLDSASYWSYCFTIRDSIVYTPEWISLKRFDLRTRKYLQNVRFALPYAWGTKKYQDTMYYCDFERGIIGAVPILDLRVVP